VEKIYTKTDNGLYFQDGAGNEHLVLLEAFSSMFFHSSPTISTVTISTVNALVKIDSFNVVGSEDSLGNLTGSTSTNDITVGADGAGNYGVGYHGSVTVAGGGSKEVLFVTGTELATALDITNVTDNTISPIVITSTAHLLQNGDIVEIENVLVNTAANGSFIVANRTANTFEIVALDGSATTGNGDYDEGTPTGDITKRYTGSGIVHIIASQTDLRAISVNTFVNLLAGDKISVCVANLNDTSNIEVAAVTINSFIVSK